MRRIRLLSGAIALASAACVAVHEPKAPSPAARAVTENRALPLISVCVDTPVPNADDATGGGEGQVRRYYREVNAASHLIESLRGTGLFSSVDFAHSPDARCEVMLVAKEVTGQPGVPAFAAAGGAESS